MVTLLASGCTMGTDMNSNTNAPANLNQNEVITGNVNINSGTVNVNTNAPAQNMNLNTNGGSSAQVYTNNSLGFTLQLAEGVKQSPAFTTDYMLADVWSLLDDGTGKGDKVAEFLVPGSNNITAAGLRIGSSKDATQVANCTKAPSYASFDTTTKTIGGVSFTELSLSDAAMSHYRTVNSYRVVRSNTCLVFDAFVSGTNPDVYDPPATAPFTREDAMSKAESILQTIRFI